METLDERKDGNIADVLERTLHVCGEILGFSQGKIM